MGEKKTAGKDFQAWSHFDWRLLVSSDQSGTRAGAAGPGRGGTRPLWHVKKLNMMNLTRPAVLNLAAKNLL